MYDFCSNVSYAYNILAFADSDSFTHPGDYHSLEC